MIYLFLTGCASLLGWFFYVRKMTKKRNSFEMESNNENDDYLKSCKNNIQKLYS